MRPLWVAIDSKSDETRVLVTAGPRETVLKARLSPTPQYPRAVVQAPQHRLRVLPCDAALPPLPVWLSWPAEQGRDASAVVASMHAFIDDSLT